MEGRKITCTVLGSGDETVLFLGGIHGSEPAGTVLCRKLIDYLLRHPAALWGRRVVIAPAINPDGLVINSRKNARGVDINRNFNTGNRHAKKQFGMEPLSEPESRFIAELIQRYKPIIIISIHQPLRCVDWDGPARDLAALISRVSGLPLRKLGAKPGSLGSYAGDELGIPIVTLELPGEAIHQSPDKVWRDYGHALIVTIRYDLSPKL